MNKRRLELNEILVNVLGSNNVYFQPPATVKIKYPCVIYKRNSQDTIYSNDLLYRKRQSYEVMVIDSNPDSNIPGKIEELPLCRFDRHYTSDNLNHDVYVIYY